MKMLSAILAVAFVAFPLDSAHPQDSKAVPPSEGKTSVAHVAKPGTEYSGMYSFLKDGEFVQITVEDEGRVTGFISRYGEGGSDNGTFLDQFFRSGKLEGSKLSFTTAAVHGVWFDFKGTVERGDGKNPSDESYYVLKGTLAENVNDAAKNVTTHSSDVVFKRFPQEAPPARN
ncbi:MAG TPA: hypothetical protein VFF64_16640 [Candidatus Eremiobacteraceae bacterium]|nr:hypothetical protein [Candidatus Eremiobacteraceae bacterium]